MKKVLLKKDFYFGLGLMLVLPMVTMAQSDGLFELLDVAGQLIARLIPLIIGVAVITFLWGVLSYVTASDDAKQKEARGIMMYGIIVLFVMVSIWGLVNLLGDTISLTDTAPEPPQIPGFDYN